MSAPTRAAPGDAAVRLATVRRAAAERLREVIDPELGVDIVSLGLVYGLDLIDDVLNVHIAVTTPTCPLAGYLVHRARTALEGIPGVSGVWADLALEPAWSPSMMSDGARSSLGWNG